MVWWNQLFTLMVLSETAEKDMKQKRYTSWYANESIVRRKHTLAGGVLDGVSSMRYSICRFSQKINLKPCANQEMPDHLKSFLT